MPVVLVAGGSPAPNAAARLRRTAPTLTVRVARTERAALQHVQSGAVDCLVVVYPGVSDPGGLLAAAVSAGAGGVCWTRSPSADLARRVAASGATYVPEDDWNETATVLESVRTQARERTRSERTGWVGGDGPVGRRPLADQLASVERTIVDALVERVEPTELRRVVCESLTALESVAVSWAGVHDEEMDAIRASQWAGLDGGYCATDQLPTAAGGRDSSIGERLLDGEVVTVRDIAEGTLSESRTERSLARGYRSAVFVPLMDDGVCHGAVAVYGTKAGQFDERTRQSFRRLGRTVGFALANLTHHWAEPTGTITELEFRSSDERVLAVELSRTFGCTVEIRGLSLSGGSLTILLWIEDADAEDAAAVAMERSDVQSATSVVSTEHGSILKVDSDDQLLTAFLADQGMVLRRVTATAGVATAVIELPADADVRAVAEAIDEAYADTKLLARRERTTRLTPWEFRAQVEETLTDRQFEVLQLAYTAGFYDWPREASGEDLARSLGVSQPTFLEHLRTGERKLFEQFFDENRRVYVADE
ncbi:bacterio-opsin activator domain-containing protein [Haloarchaeobius sp. TZWWS8]|uniref:bacterio-opsin activator domain-containing protein n=1 Tax=Haloarchaeobius sp. TZWWS8 TaxID=3446121 RepID=UPI003EBBBEB7